MKSLVTDNLGFAIPSKHLAAAQEAEPGADVALGHARRPRRRRVEAEPRRHLAAAGRPHHRRRAGDRLRRPQLLLPRRAAAAEGFPYEIRVTVKLDNEAGAAGLFFGGNDGDKHFGFYPTAGKLRLTQFAGPDVYDVEDPRRLRQPRATSRANGTRSRCASRRTRSSASSTSSRSSNAAT